MGLIDEVRIALTRYRMLEPGCLVLVGVSGGPDSVALLYVLSLLGDEYKVCLHVAHLNHALRGEDAEQDVVYVRRIANSLGVGFTARRRDIRELARKEGLSEEVAGRRERYSMFIEVAREIGASRVALGHNRDDQVETVLMRFLRGSGIEGLSGIPPMRKLAEGLAVIRPLINVPRKDIEEYCRNEHLQPRCDRTNLEPMYLRNRLRFFLLPLLETEFNPGIRNVLARTAEVCRDDSVYLESQGQKMFETIARKNDSVEIPSDVLRDMAPALRRRVLRSAIRSACGHLEGIEYIHINQMEELLAQGRTGSELDLPGDLRVGLGYGVLYVTRQREVDEKPFVTEVCVPGTTEIPEANCTLEVRIADRDDVQAEMRQAWSDKVAFLGYFDYNKMVLPLYVRSRLPGDAFKPLGLQGTKKVKDFFISEKVPRSIRGKVPILVSGGEIAWIIGMRPDERFKVTRDTKVVLIIRVTSTELPSGKGGITGEQGLPKHNGIPIDTPG